MFKKGKRNIICPAILIMLECNVSFYPFNINTYKFYVQFKVKICLSVDRYDHKSKVRYIIFNLPYLDPK